MSLPFAKLHGLGNDFIVVDLRSQTDSAWFDDAAVIRALCDRHRGVGADGVLAILPPSLKGRESAADARMRVRNADGSRRPATLADVTHVRWHMARPIPAGGAGELRFRGIVK